MDYKVYSALCRDEKCRTKLYFPAHKMVIECSNCGQTHTQNNLHNIEEVTDGEEAFTQVLKSIVWDTKLPKKGSDSVKVHGLSNYHCKLLSPLFTRYGMDKAGNPKLLSELGHGETADCGRLLSHRAFLISPDHINITGYGRDQSGSVRYLNGLLEILKEYHCGEERLIPIHADGDGHCLVHALSRATTGREIFWHALRDNLVHHLEEHLQTYQIMFQDFIDKNDWRLIIEEADPYHTSPDGFNIGLGNIHIFALANVLKRPIVLLDSLQGMKNVADYSAIFVPALVEPSECRNNLPLCVAWSGSSHNHFVPLVGVAGRTLPSIPSALLPNIWGIDKNQGARYLNFNDDGSLDVAGGKPLQTGYLLRLVSAMEKVFMENHSIAAKLVTDMHLYVYQRVGFVGLHPDVAIDKTKEAVSKNKIFRCLVCGAMSLSKVEESSLRPGGYLFEVMRSSHGEPQENVSYSFPVEGLICIYDATSGCLIPYRFPCMWCGVKRLRKVDNLGNTIYENADATSTPADIPGQCCGFKHYWDGCEYENIPKQFMLNITLQEKSVEEKITWFFGDSNPALNSDERKVARNITEKYYGSDDPNFEELLEKVQLSLQSILTEYGLTDVSHSSRHVQRSCGETASFIKTSRLKHRAKSNNATKEIEKTYRSSQYKADEQSSSRLLKENETPTTIELSTSKNHITEKTNNNMLKIRISTSDGRQETVVVESDLDYTGLQNTVQKYFGISPNRQILKHGFPPRLLEPGRGKISLSLRNGDRITVEIKQEKNLSDIDYAESIPRHSGLLKKGIKNATPELGSRERDTLHTFVNLLKSANDLQNLRRNGTLSSASIDTALSAVSKMAEMTGKVNEWDYSINHPELFQPGGAFYEQFGRDIGLLHEKHCKLPLLPGRVFRYNGLTDQLELCLEPDGHYPIGPDIVKTIDTVENRRLNSSVTGSQNENEAEPMDSQDCDNSSMTEENSIEETEQMQVDNEDAQLPAETTSQTIPSSNVKLDDPMRLPSHESKAGPGYTTLGSEPAQVSTEAAEVERNKLLEMLKSKKKDEE